jgi:hypothetical protein
VTKRLFLLARSVLSGWATLLASVYLLQRPLLPLLARWLDASWVPTVNLALACAILAATGWIVGRLSRPASFMAVLVFAVTLCFLDRNQPLGIEIPWLLRLSADALRDPRYWSSLLDTAAVQAILFGSLISGAWASRQAPGKPLSIL